MPDPLQLTPDEAKILIAALDYRHDLQRIVYGLFEQLKRADLIENAPMPPHPEADGLVDKVRDRLLAGVVLHAAGGTDDIDIRPDIDPNPGRAQPRGPAFPIAAAQVDYYLQRDLLRALRTPQTMEALELRFGWPEREVTRHMLALMERGHIRALSDGHGGTSWEITPAGEDTL